MSNERSASPFAGVKAPIVRIVVVWLVSPVTLTVGAARAPVGRPSAERAHPIGMRCSETLPITVPAGCSERDWETATC
jgi:hypothetical protein